MRVITYDEKDIKEGCRQLADKITRNNFKPELILGVKTGGVDIAKGLHKYFPTSDLKFCSVKKKSHAGKTRRIKNHLKKLPRFILDFLRIIEARFLFHLRSRTSVDEVILPDEIDKKNTFLIVDDALDTGTTLQSIIAELKLKNQKAAIQTAVFTVTTKQPVIFPDYTLFNNQTLLRFPWSRDA